MNFPEFMFSDKNKIPMAQQNTPDVADSQSTSMKI